MTYTYVQIFILQEYNTKYTIKKQWFNSGIYTYVSQYCFEVVLCCNNLNTRIIVVLKKLF